MAMGGAGIARGIVEIYENDRFSFNPFPPPKPHTAVRVAADTRKLFLLMMMMSV